MTMLALAADSMLDKATSFVLTTRTRIFQRYLQPRISILTQSNRQFERINSEFSAKYWHLMGPCSGERWHQHLVTIGELDPMKMTPRRFD